MRNKDKVRKRQAAAAKAAVVAAQQQPQIWWEEQQAYWSARLEDEFWSVDSNSQWIQIPKARYFALVVAYHDVVTQDI